MGIWLWSYVAHLYELFMRSNLMIMCSTKHRTTPIIIRDVQNGRLFVYSFINFGTMNKFQFQTTMVCNQNYVTLWQWSMELKTKWSIKRKKQVNIATRTRQTLNDHFSCVACVTWNDRSFVKLFDHSFNCLLIDDGTSETPLYSLR